MAVAYSTAGAFAASASTSSLSTAFPATVNNGDIAIIVAMSFQNITFPVAFTSEAQATNAGGSGTNMRLGWKRCNGTEGGTSVNVTLGAASATWARIIIFTGAIASGTPYEGYTTNAATNLGTSSMTTVAVTSTVANTLGVLIAICNNNVTSTPAAGYTERLDSGTATGGGAATTVDDIAKVASGTTASGTIATSALPSAYCVFGFAIQPPAGDTLAPTLLRFM